MKKKLYDYKLAENSTSLYMFALFLILPLYFNNDYINILESKTFIFVLITWIYLIAFVICIWLESIFRAEKERKISIKNYRHKSKALPKKKLKQDIFFIIFLCAVIISTLCSGDILNAWHAPEGKLFGARILLLCCGLYYFVSIGTIAQVEGIRAGTTKVYAKNLHTGKSLVYTVKVVPDYDD